MLWYLAIQNNSLYVYNRVLMEYRRHIESATNHVGHYTIEQRLEICERHTKVIDMLIGMNNERQSDRTLLLENMRKWYRLRVALIKDKRLSCALKLLLNIKYYSKPRQFLVDVKLALIG